MILVVDFAIVLLKHLQLPLAFKSDPGLLENV
jgi:hypothetical protein